MNKCNGPSFGHIDTNCREAKSKKYTDEVVLYFETELLKKSSKYFIKKKYIKVYVFFCREWDIRFNFNQID